MALQLNLVLATDGVAGNERRVIKNVQVWIGVADYNIQISTYEHALQPLRILRIQNCDYVQSYIYGIHYFHSIRGMEAHKHVLIMWHNVYVYV